MRISSVIITIFLLSSCAAVLPPEERVGKWEDWELCHNFADYAYAGKSKWLWYSSAEISKRGLDKDARCKSIFDSRIKAFTRKRRQNDIVITFSDALNQNTDFENAVKQ